MEMARQRLGDTPVFYAQYRIQLLDIKYPHGWDELDAERAGLPVDFERAVLRAAEVYRANGYG